MNQSNLACLDPNTFVVVRREKIRNTFDAYRLETVLLLSGAGLLATTGVLGLGIGVFLFGAMVSAAATTSQWQSVRTFDKGVSLFLSSKATQQRIDRHPQLLGKPLLRLSVHSKQKMMVTDMSRGMSFCLMGVAMVLVGNPFLSPILMGWGGVNLWKSAHSLHGVRKDKEYLHFVEQHGFHQDTVYETIDNLANTKDRNLLPHLEPQQVSRTRVPSFDCFDDQNILEQRAPIHQSLVVPRPHRM